MYVVCILFTLTKTSKLDRPANQTLFSRPTPDLFYDSYVCVDLWQFVLSKSEFRSVVVAGSGVKVHKDVRSFVVCVRDV